MRTFKPYLLLLCAFHLFQVTLSTDDEFPEPLQFRNRAGEGPRRSLECRSCSERKSSLTPSELRELRYSIVKGQILQKLQMTHPPQPSMPKPSLKPLLVLTENVTDEEESTNPGQDDSVEKSESVVINSEGQFPCVASEASPCIQLRFKLPKHEGIESFSSVELWLPKSDPESVLGIMEVVSGPFGALDSKHLSVQNESDSEPWTKFQLPSNVLWSNTAIDYVLTLEVSCQSECERVTSSGPEDRPFLVIRTVTARPASRARRSVDCVEGSTGCCRETFYLNFSEIGWDNWILHPDGYYANFCRGRCVNDFSNTRFYHSAVLVSYMQDNDDIAEDMGLNMCCTPSAMAPVSIIYRTEDGMIYHKSIENMKVEACDCA